MKIKLAIVILSGVLSAFLLARAAFASVYTVNSTLDLPDGDPSDGVCATSPPGTPVCTLRAAVMQANAHAGPDSISIPAGTYVLTRVGFDATAALGDLDINGDLTIASSSDPVIIDANGAASFDRAFEVITGSLALTGVTIQNGNTLGSGGAIYTTGTLVLIDVTIQNNTAAQGGGIYASGAIVQITSSTIRSNTAQDDGGGIKVEGSSPLFPQFDINNSLIENNRALGIFGSGGGLAVYAATGAIRNSTLRNNMADGGGGLRYVGSFGGLRLGMTNTLVISNSALTGGGLFLSGITSLADSQIVSNVASYAGGLHASGGTHTLNDVTISGNTATVDSCGGALISSASLNMNRGWVEHNGAQTQGGGLCGRGAGDNRLAITDTNVLNNHAVQGGGVWVNTSFFATRSAICQNSATHGGGVYALWQAIIENSTLSSNTAGRDGGGIYADGGSTVHLNSATLASNQARTSYPSPGAGGGIYISTTAVVSVANTLISNNTNSPFAIAYSDCFGTLGSEAYNFIGSNTGCTITGDSTGNHVGGDFPSNLDPLIEPLNWVTGMTPGHLPRIGSPLYNAGRPSGCQAAQGGFLSVDQIGHDRASDGRCDIGAIEYFDLQRVYLPLAKK